MLSPSQVDPLLPRLWDTQFEERWWSQNSGLAECIRVSSSINRYRKHTTYYSKMNHIEFNSDKILKQSCRNISKYSSKTICQFCKKFVKVGKMFCFFVCTFFFRIIFKPQKFLFWAGLPTNCFIPQTNHPTVQVFERLGKWGLNWHQKAKAREPPTCGE